MSVPRPQGDRPPGGYTVLVVDDEEAVRQLAVRMLTWTGYRRSRRGTGGRRWRPSSSTMARVHLVLTDIKMPGMNGRELGRHVEQRWPGKPILYMSGFASEVFQGGLLEPGAPFLAKPFTQEDLAAKVRALLESAVNRAVRDSHPTSPVRTRGRGSIGLLRGRRQNPYCGAPAKPRDGERGAKWHKC